MDDHALVPGRIREGAVNDNPFEMRTTASRAGLASTGLVLMAGMGLAPGATYATIPDASRFRYHVEATAIPEFRASANIERSLSLHECVLEIRRLSGLTWEEIAKIFGVSRRSINNWALGGRLTEENAEKVRRVLANMRMLYDSSPARTAGILRGMRGETPIFEVLPSMKITDGSRAESSLPTNPKFDADASRLMANWNPTSLNGIIETENDIDDTPLKNMKPLAVRVPKLPRRPSEG